MLRKIFKTAMYIILAVGCYLVIGYTLHLVIFPEKKPTVAGYFKPGDQFYGKKEGFLQTVLKQENGLVHCSLVAEPFAAGPPKHIHTGFDETFEVANGELSLWVDGKLFKVRPGDKVFVPRGTPHKPFNETADTIHVKGSVAFPEKFAYHLPQVYGLMDNDSTFGKSFATLLQMSLMASYGFDSYAVEGPPVAIQKAAGFLLVPISRLLGYKSFYNSYDIRK